MTSRLLDLRDPAHDRRHTLDLIVEGEPPGETSVSMDYTVYRGELPIIRFRYEVNWGGMGLDRLESFAVFLANPPAPDDLFHEVDYVSHGRPAQSKIRSARYFSDEGFLFSASSLPSTRVRSMDHLVWLLLVQRLADSDEGAPHAYQYGLWCEREDLVRQAGAMRKTVERINDRLTVALRRVREASGSNRPVEIPDSGHGAEGAASLPSVRLTYWSLVEVTPHVDRRP
jgi:hypothetical protein